MSASGPSGARSGLCAPSDGCDGGSGSTRDHQALDVAVIATAAAGVFHAGVTKQHLDEYWLYGVFFAASAAAQLAWAAVAIRRPDRLLLWLAGVGNAAVIGLWIVTRTIGVPLGPDKGEVEGAAAADVAATLYEATAVAACVYLLRRWQPDAVRPPRLGPVELFAATVVLAAALVLVLVSHGPD